MVKMRRLVQGLIGATLLLAGTHAYAATYYFSTSGNNTTGAGTVASPFYSLCGPWVAALGCSTGTSKISLGQIPVNPGDQFLFKRGEEWVGWDAVWNINATGAPGNPLTFGTYGDPNLPRPVFRGAKSAFELGIDSWTNLAGTSIWYASGVTSTPYVAAQEETAPGGPALYGAWSVQGVTNANGWTSNQSMVRGTYFYESTTQRLYVWRTDDLKPDHAAGREIYIGGAPADGTNRLVKVKRATGVAGSDYIFQDLHVKLSSGYGFSTSYPNTTFINCLSELNSMEGFLFDRRRFGAPVPGSKDGVMRNCVARRNNLKQGSGAGQGITIESENVWIYDSESYENAWAGIDFLDYDVNTKVEGGGVVNSKIHNNGIQPVSQSCFDPNIYVDGGSNITIQNCQIWGAGVDPRGIKTRNKSNPGISIDVEGNGFAAGRRPSNIKILNTLSYGNMGAAVLIGTINGSQSAVDAFSNIHLIGNTFSRDRGDSDIKGYYDPNVIDAGIRPIKFYNIASGFVFKNNIVVAMNTARAPLFGEKAMYDGGKSRMDFDNNIYYCPGCDFNTAGGSNSGGFFSFDYITNMSIDQFRNLGAQASLRQDETLSKAIVTSNPLLANVTTAAFDAHLMTSSPALDVAAVSAFPAGLTGTTRVDGAADQPYNDLGFHYPLTGSAPPPPPAVDTQAPSIPANLTVSQADQVIFLSWTASTDNVGVTGYQISNGEVLVGSSSTNSFMMNGTAGQSYSFAVRAIDAVNNISASSSIATLTIPGGTDTTVPASPTGVVVTFTGTQATINWNASTDNVGVTGYQVLMSFTPIATTTTTSYTRGSLTAGQSYTFRIRAYDAAGNYSGYGSSGAVTVPATTDAQAPSAPANFAAIQFGTDILMSWSAATDDVGVVGYRLFDGAVLLGTSVATNYTLASPAVGSTHDLSVQAYDAANNNSSPSNTVALTVGPLPDTAAPTAPSVLTAMETAGPQIVLSWAASTDNVGVAGYQIFDGAALLGTSASNSFTVQNAAAGQTYMFSVLAYDAANNISSSSNPVTFTTAPPPDTTAPSSPSTLTASGSGAQIVLSWAASTDNVGVTGYQVLNNGVLVGTTTSLGWTLSNAAVGTYAFAVRAFDAENNLSASSNTATFTVVPTPDTSAPASPTGVVVTFTGTQATINWNASTDNVGVTGYQVLMSFTPIATTTTTSYTRGSLTAGQSYTFRIRAYDAAGNYSGYGSSGAVTVPATQLPTPLNFTASYISGQIQMAWAPSTGATGYNVYRNDALLKAVVGTSTFDNTVTPGSTYQYKVNSSSGSNNVSTFSNTVSVAIPGNTVDTVAPTAPTSLLASLAGTTANLVWSASTDNIAVTGYQVFKDATLQTVSTALNFAASGLTQGQTYSFSVKAIDAASNTSTSSDLVSVTVPVPPDTMAPSAPTGLAATLTGSTANLSWAASTDNVGVTGYQVFEGTTLRGTTASLSYSIVNLSTGSHTFSVRANDAANNISVSSSVVTVSVPDTLAPSAPSGLSASASGTTASLTWAASTDNVAVTGYRVFDGATQLGTTNSLLYSATGLSVSSHSFTVRAIDAANNVSAPSNTATVTIASTAPGTPTNLIAYLSGSSVSVAWSSATNAAGYAVYRNGAFLANITSTSMMDSNVTPGQTYSYQVLAYNATGVNSGLSNSMSVTIPGSEPVPAIPGNFRVSAPSSGNISMSWNASAGAAGYRIYRNGSLRATTGGADFAEHPGGGTWRYKVEAYNNAGVGSGFTNEVTVSTTR